MYSIKLLDGEHLDTMAQSYDVDRSGLLRFFDEEGALNDGKRTILLVIPIEMVKYFSKSDKN